MTDQAPDPGLLTYTQGAGMESHPHWVTLGTSVLQAMGMVSIQADCSLDDALQMMRDRALVQQLSLTAIANAVLDRKIRFGPQVSHPVRTVGL